MTTDILCFSHLRWNFVFQRPQHLMTRFARNGRVFFIEEPVYDSAQPFLAISKAHDADVTVIVPHLQREQNVNTYLPGLLENFVKENSLQDFIAWYYSPMALAYTDTLSPSLVVYDCMDELSGFNFAPPELKEREARLFAMADVVFTGGHTLFEAKKKQHHYIFSMPSSIDKDRFAKARTTLPEPEDQKSIPHPRLGFYGVLDERLDIALIEELATLRPEWQIILLGPVVKIDPATLPKNKNIHYLGGKSYADLPGYLSAWDIAIMPFALNASTRFISPTKTPEYLAGGKPVISTPITDVVNDYGKPGLVAIAKNASQFIEHAERILTTSDNATWLSKVDAHLAEMSWDNTWKRMTRHIENVKPIEKVMIRDQFVDVKTQSHV